MTALAERQVASRNSITSMPRLTIVLVLLGFYLLASLGSDSRAYLSTDTGGKAATLEAMVSNDSWQPDLGYWAEAHDPDGSLYPMFSTSRVGDQWVNVTSLPMIMLVRPLYELGGYRLALLVPMIGAAVSALLAAALARRLGGNPNHALWIVGLASPVTIYALDLWEHTLGLALMLGAVVLGIDLVRGDRGIEAAVAVGALFGLAASMRQEALVYGFMTGIMISASTLRRFGPARCSLLSVSVLGGLIATTAANWMLERIVYGSAVRAGRSASTFGGGGQRAGERLVEAAITGGGPFASTSPSAVAFAVLLAAALIWLAVAAVEGWPLRFPMVTVGTVYAMVTVDIFLNGLRFVPGLLAAAPVAAIGLVVGVTSARLRPVAVIAVGSLPLIWAVQYLGGAAPQWGGRYLLCSMVLLVVLALSGFDGDRRILLALAATGLVMSLTSIVWLWERTDAVATTMQELSERPEQAVIFSDPFVPREAGPIVLNEQWLVAAGAQQRSEAAVVLADGQIESFVFVDLQIRDASGFFDGFVATGVDETDFLGSMMTLTSFEALE